jgi:hypothetical protein
MQLQRQDRTGARHPDQPAERAEKRQSRRAHASMRGRQGILHRDGHVRHDEAKAESEGGDGQGEHGARDDEQAVLEKLGRQDGLPRRPDVDDEERRKQDGGTRGYADLR